MSVKILTGDMLECLPRLIPKESIDCLIVDPPYGETSLEWDRRVAGWPLEVRRVLKPTGSMWVFGSARMFLETADEFDGWRLAQDIVWEKHNGSAFHNDRFKRVHEQAVHFYRGVWGNQLKNVPTTPDAVARTITHRAKRRPTHTGDIGRAAYQSIDGGPRLMRSVIQVRSTHGYAEHPTQKPLGILTPLIEFSVAVDGMVLDPFMGSGSTLVAAKAIGRKAIGIEVNEADCETAVRRCSQEVLGLDSGKSLKDFQVAERIEDPQQLVVDGLTTHDWDELLDAIREMRA